MINYPYPTLFLTEGTQKDLLITDGTVTVVGTTYTVSDETVLIDNSVLESEAFELYQSLNSEMQIEFGSCDTGSIRFTIRKNDNSNIVGTVLKVYLIPNHDASKMLQLGVFRVSEDVRSQDHKQHTIVAHDAMYSILNADVSSWYNTILPDDNTTVTLSAFRTSFLANFNITAEAVTLINDSSPIRRTLKIVKDDNAPGHESLKSVSGSDIIKSICQINAVFGTITNEGKFRYVSLVDPISSSQETTEIPVSYCVDVNTGEEFYPFRAIEVKTSKRTQTKAWGVIIGGRNTYKVTNNPLIDDYSEDELDDLVNALFTAVDGHAYTPFTLTAIGNPLHEVGDPIKVYKPDGTFFYSYIFERRMTGVQSLRDTYSANSEGTWVENLNSISNRVQSVESSEGGGGGGGDASHANTAWKLRSSPVDNVSGERYYTYLTQNKHFVVSNDEEGGHTAENDRTEECTIGQSANPWKAGYFKDLFMDGERVVANFPEIIRNIGYRLLDEPVVAIEYDPLYERVLLSWSDPYDIDTNEPVTATWAGTVVVRNDERKPLHRWDGELIVNSTELDEYSETDFPDEDVEVGTTYYYGIFPYDTRGWYRYTKVVSITPYPMPIPDIISLYASGTTVTVAYSIPPEYTWSQIGVVCKKDAIPADKTDGRVMDITNAGGIADVIRLAPESLYYFRIFSTESTTSKEFISEAQSVITGQREPDAFTEVISITKAGGDLFDVEEEVTITKL